jgi:hypothetical protein
MADINPQEIPESVTIPPVTGGQEPAPSSGVVVAAVPALETPAAPAAPATEGALEHGETLLQKFEREEAEAKNLDGVTPPAGEAAKPVEAKPEEKKAEGEAAPAEAAAPAALPPVAYEYAVPETIKIDDALKGELHTALDGFRADPAKGFQPLLDLHAKAMADASQAMVKEQFRQFHATNEAWVKEVMGDPELGGSGFRTAMGVVARMRDRFVPETMKPAFEQFLAVTGAGNHPAFLRLMVNVGKAFDEPSLPPPNPKPTPSNGSQPKRTLRDTYNKG